MYKILVIILYLGNLKFVVDGDMFFIENGKVVFIIVELLFIKIDMVEKVFFYWIVVIGCDIIDK